MNRYFTSGSMSEAEGLTFFVNQYDENGNFVGGVENWEKNIYKPKEITEEEYLQYMEMMKNPKTIFGLVGIVNEEGQKKMIERIGEFKQSSYDFMLSVKEPQIALTVKKIKKQLELGIITTDDIDTEIELNNMKQFTDEIKKRLEQN